MIDQLPEHRPLPADVRMRARRRLSEGMNPGAGNRTPALIAAGVSLLAAGAVFGAQLLYGGNAEVAAPSQAPPNQFVGKDRAVVNHVELGKVDPDALARCVAAAKAHPPAAQWQPLATSHKDGTVLTAFRAPTGLFFCANTATTTTISAPDDTKVEAERRQVKILFTTPSGALAGLVSPDVKFLSLSRIGDQGWNNTMPALVEGLLLAPSGYTQAENGTMALANGNEFAVRGVPRPTAPVVDRPLAAADRSTPEAQRFAQCLKDRPIPDADQFALGVTAKVSPTSTIMLGRFGDLMIYCLDDGGPLRGRVYDIQDPDGMDVVYGKTVGAVRAFYDFTTRPDGASSSSNLAAVGLVRDPRVASITYTAPGAADVPAALGNGTFVLAGPLNEPHPEGRVVVRDAAGAVLETITPTR
ncbi:hypothetical protein ACIA8G_06650 [Lentzea sp. NPDC051213]|uniref:hypothetical protein n=1 Tax=Lentzea sp. NPDC051213 TaxID=3364126 RepID=UPI0037AFA0B7